MKKIILLQFAIILGLVLFLSISWEFYLEQFVQENDPESVSEKWEFIFTSFVFACIALIYPLGSLLKSLEDRKLTEKKIRRLGKVFDSNISEFFIFDAQTFQFIEANQTAQINVGYNLEELKQMTPLDIKPNFTTQQFNHLIKPLLSKEKNGIAFETVHKRKDGSVYPVRINLEYVEEDNGGTFFVIAQDMTLQKEGELKLVAAKEEAEQSKNKEQKANQAKSEFLSQMSHELRTPLNAILGFGQIMEMDREEQLTESHKQRVRAILKAGHHLLDLINEILDLSRIESGHLTLSMENVNLNFLSEELVTLCDPMAKKSNIELFNIVPLHDDIYVWADRVRLKQVLLNLVSNAIKYNKAGGTVKIDANGSKEGEICISVTDTGVGIPADRLADLFQPFDRLGSEKTDIEGTGVGLTISKRLVEYMNGSIEVDSRPGEGSTFSVTFPIGEKEEEAQDLPQKEISQEFSSCPPRERWVVLYVEDNPANLTLVRQILHRRSNVMLLTAPDAKLGIELAQAHQPDLILLDITLPDMDGLTAFKYLKVMEETRNTPVIAISANALPRDIKNALETGFSDYLTQPLDVAEFNRVIEEQLKIGSQRK